MLDKVSKNPVRRAESEKDFLRDSKFGFNFVISLLISQVSAGLVNTYIQINLANTFEGGRWSEFFDFDFSQVAGAFLGICVWLPLYGLGLILVSFAVLCLQSSWKVRTFRVIWVILLVAATYLAATVLVLLDSLANPNLRWYLVGQIISTMAFLCMRHLVGSLKDPGWKAKVPKGPGQ